MLALLGALTLTMTACLPATPPPSAAKVKLAAAPATTVPNASSATCGTAVNWPAAADVSATPLDPTTTDPAAGSSASATPDTDDAISASTAKTQAADAARQAIADPTIPGTAGDVPLVVTTVDADGHPDIQTISATSVSNASKQAARVTNDINDDGGSVLAVEPEHTMSASTTTATDPYRGSEWALNQLDFEHVWDTTSGSGECVAVLDTGIDLTHPDLTGRVAATHDQTGQGVQDGYGHGTHVAGIIAADANNGIGVAGAAPGVSLMVVKVLGNDGVGNSSWTSAGIIWAVDHGAKVINLSLGASCPSTAPSGCNTTDMQTAITYAQNRDVVVVAAGGNDGDPTSAHHGYWSWPAATTWPIAVAAVDSNDQHASYSTQAPYLDVAAPGTGIISTMSANSVIGGQTGHAQYASLSGTSMATPYVTAEVALLRAAHPSENAGQIRNRVTGHVTDLGTPGVDTSFGAGLINPGAALAG